MSYEHDKKNECPFCDGCGYILEDKDQYYYFGAEQIRRANDEKNADWRRRMFESARSMKGVPMQPLAIECPKCGGTGRRTE